MLDRGRRGLNVASYGGEGMDRGWKSLSLGSWNKSQGSGNCSSPWWSYDVVEVATIEIGDCTLPVIWWHNSVLEEAFVD